MKRYLAIGVCLLAVGCGNPTAPSTSAPATLSGRGAPAPRDFPMPCPDNPSCGVPDPNPAPPCDDNPQCGEPIPNPSPCPSNPLCGVPFMLPGELWY